MAEIKAKNKFIDLILQWNPFILVYLNRFYFCLSPEMFTYVIFKFALFGSYFLGRQKQSIFKKNFLLISLF
jgi:hypothetical protein